MAVSKNNELGAWHSMRRFRDSSREVRTVNWQEQQAIDKQTVSTLARAVARVMGWNYIQPTSDDTSRYIEKDGQQVSIGIVWNQRDRVVIRGAIHKYQNFLPYKYDNPEITVAIARGAEVIAKEITRRVLPGYTLLLTQLQKSKAAHEEHQRIVQRNLGELMAVLINVPGLRQASDHPKFWVRHCDVEVFADSANLKLDLPINVAKQVLEVIRPLAMNSERKCYHCNALLLYSSDLCPVCSSDNFGKQPTE